MAFESWSIACFKLHFWNIACVFSDTIKEGTDSKYDRSFSKLSVLPYFKHDR